MQNSQLLELLLAQRRQQQNQQQQQRDLVQQMVAAATGGNQYPLSSAILNLASLAPGPAPPAASNALLLRELEQQLGGGVGGGVTGLGAPTNAAASSASSTLLQLGGGASSGTVGNASPSLSSVMAGVNPLQMSNEDLLRTVAAAGLLAPTQQSAANAIANFTAKPPPPAAMSLPSLLETLASADDASRKREGAPCSFVGTTEGYGEERASLLWGGVEPSQKKQRVWGINAAEEARGTNNNHPNQFMQKIGTAPTELDKKQRSSGASSYSSAAPAAPPVLVTDPANRRFRFPLPLTIEKKQDEKFIPDLGSFRNAWNNLKTKRMQKEIFLRKLHHGKLALSSSRTLSEPPSAATAKTTGGISSKSKEQGSTTGTRNMKSAVSTTTARTDFDNSPFAGLVKIAEAAAATQAKHAVGNLSGTTSSTSTTANTKKGGGVIAV